MQKFNLTLQQTFPSRFSQALPGALWRGLCFWWAAVLPLASTPQQGCRKGWDHPRWLEAAQEAKMRLVGAVRQRAWTEADSCWPQPCGTTLPGRLQRENTAIRKGLVVRILWVWVSSAKCLMDNSLAGSLPACLPAASEARAGCCCAASGSSTGDWAPPAPGALFLPASCQKKAGEPNTARQPRRRRRSVWNFLP